MIASTIAIGLLSKTIFGLLWYVMILLCAAHCAAKWRLTKLAPIKNWLIAFLPLFFNFAFLEIYLAGFIFTAGLQHFRFTNEQIIIGAKYASVLAVILTVYEFFYLGISRVGSDFNPINFGMAAGIISIICAVNINLNKNNSGQISNYICLLLSIAAMIFSGSRGPLLAFVIVSIVLIILSKNIAKRQAGPSKAPKLFGAFLIFIILVGVTLHFNRTVDEIVLTESSSSGLRIVMAKEAVNKIQTVPFFGIGAGETANFLGTLDNPLLGQFKHVHNSFLNFSLELGIFGGLAFLWAIGYLLTIFLSYADQEYLFAALCGLLIVIFIFFCSLFNDVFSHSYSRKLIAFYFSIFLVLVHKSTSESKFS
jgi:O-antigen ligase